MLLRQDSPYCAMDLEHEAISYPTNLDIEDVEEEDEDDTEEIEGDGTDEAQAVSNMDDWEDTLIGIDGDDGDGDEDDESGASVDEMLILDDPDQEYFISLSDSQKTAVDKLKKMLCSNSLVTDSDILNAFANVILQVFASKVVDVGVEERHRNREGDDVEEEWEGLVYVERTQRGTPVKRTILRWVLRTQMRRRRMLVVSVFL